MDINQFEKEDAQIVAMKNILLKKMKRIPLRQQKIFYLVISQLNYSKKNVLEVNLLKKDVFEYLGITNCKDRYKWCKEDLISLMTKTLIEFKRGEKFSSGFLFYNVSFDGNYYSIKINETYSKLIEELDNEYTRLLLKDVVTFKTNYALLYYQYFMMNSNISIWKPTTKDLKDMLGLDINSYCRKDGKFDRPNFEKRCIISPINEINKTSKTLNITWHKVKNGRLVIGYDFIINRKDVNDCTNEAIKRLNKKIENEKEDARRNQSIKPSYYKWWEKNLD